MDSTGLPQAGITGMGPATAMRLTVNGQDVPEAVSDELIDRAIRGLSGEGDSFAILARDRMSYLQTAGGPEHGFVLEYQDGSLERHYASHRTNLRAGQVIEAFQRYRAGDERWRTDIEWDGPDLDSAPRGAGNRRWLALLLTTVAGLVLAYFVFAR